MPRVGVGLSHALAWVLCAYALSTHAATLAVIYPQTPAPYRAVFDAMVSGIEQGARGHTVHRLPLADSDATAQVEHWLQTHAPERVITLGRRAYTAYTALPKRRYPTPIVGALDVTPDTHPDVTGVSLSVAPDLLFALLKTLRPQVRRVLVVMDPVRDTTLARAATRAAASHGLALEVYGAATLAESTTHLHNIFRYANPTTDALWLTVDGRLVDANVNLATIVSQSWAQRFTVFSNNLEHTHRGVLFSLYPDPAALGRRLATQALEGRAKGLEPLRDVKRAFNVRVARHLGVALPSAVRKQFDLILGETP